MNKRIFRNILPLLLCILLISFLNAQTNGENQANSESNETTVKAIDALNIAKRSQKFEHSQQDYERAGARQEEIKTIEENFPKFKQDLDNLINNPGMQNPDQFSERDFIDGIIIWKGLKVSLENWQTKLDNRSKELEEIILNLSIVEEIWSLTLKTGVSANYPQPVLTRIRNNLKKIKTLKTIIHSRLNELINLQNNIATQNIRIVKVINAFEEAKTAYQLSLFHRDSPPLWNIFSETFHIESLINELKTTISRQEQFIHYYYSVNESVLVIQCILFIIIFSLILFIKRTRNNLTTDDRFNIFLQRYFSSTILIFLFITITIFPKPPLFINSVYIILLIIPIIRILKQILDKEFRSSLYVFTLLLFMFEIKLILPPNSLIERSLQIVMILIILSGIVFFLKPVLKKRREQSAWFSKLYSVTTLSIYLFVVVTVFNLYGNSSMSNLVINGFTRSIFSALIIYMGVSFFQGLVIIGLSTQGIINLSIMKRKGDLIKQRSMHYIKVIGIITLFLFILSFFQLSGVTKELLFSILEFEFKVGAISITIGNILSFFIAIWIAIIISRFTRFILEEDVYPRIRLPRGVPGSISMLTHYGILAIGFLFALSAAGIEWSKFALLAGALGVGIGFGLQNIVNNFISGLILIFERPIKLGDIVEVDNLKGAVKRIGIRSSTIRTFDGSEVIVPNGQLISNTVVNWTLSDKQRRVIISVGVAYGTNPNQVLDILHGIAKNDEDVLQKPEPLALFTGFGNSSLDFELRFWTNNIDQWLILKNKLTLEIHDRLKEANIEIPFPQHDLNIRTIDDKVVEKVKREAKQKQSTNLKNKNARK